MQIRKKWLGTTLVLLFSMVIGGCANVQTKSAKQGNSFPEKPITIIVPFSVGSGMDLIARALEKSALRHLGQPLVVINKPSAGGTLGWNELAGATPDGYTVGMVSVDIELQSLYGASKYNYTTALEPIAQLAAAPLVIVTLADQPWQNLDQFVSYAKQHPGVIKFGHWGVGSFGHVLGEAFAKEAGIQITQVPFRGGGEAIVALLGGHVQMIITSPPVVAEHVKSGTVRVLAVTGDHRSQDPVFRDVPTLKERGFDVALNYWNGIGIPKEIPPAVKAHLAEGFKATIMDPEFQKNLTDLGLQVEYLDPKQAAEVWSSDSKKLTKTVQDTGILELINAQKK